MGGDRDGNPNVTAKVTRDVSYLARWIAADLYLREVDGLRFELSMSSCSDKLARIAYDIMTREQHQHDDHHHDSWFNQRQKKHADHIEIPGHPLPAHLPFGADVPGFTGNANAGEAGMPILDLPVTDPLPAFQARSVGDTVSSGMVSKEDSPTAAKSDALSLGLSLRALSVASPRSTPVTASTPPTPTSARAANPLTQSGSFKKKSASESNMKISSVDKLLHPSLRGRPDIAPYRIVLGHVRQRLLNSRRRMEMLLEGLTCDYEPDDYFETTEELLEPLLMCHESMESSGSGILADGRLADFIRRVSTFGMTLMKLDIRQESDKHSEALSAITEFLDMGTYSQWDEEKKLKFLVTELKGKRPLIPPTIEVCIA
jgi:phosphoenolpyruvate carboxylase